MNSLNRKLWRDLRHLQGQVLATALVVACGVATFVAMQSTYDSLLASRDAYYSLFRFADVFAGLKRAPESVAAEIRRIPGVAQAQTRVVAQVTIDLPDLPEPAQGRLVSVPETHTAILNDLYLLRGRFFEPDKPDEVVISGAFAEANRLHPGDAISAVINGRWRNLRVVGIALSPEYIYEIRPGDIFPDNRRFGILWMNRRAIAAAFEMENAFNDVSVTLAPQASEAAVIENLDRVLAPYGGFGAAGRADQNSHRFVSNELGELEVFGTFIPAIFLAVTAFLLHLVLSRLVSIEREQIGLLKAFGYSNAAVGLHYLKLALAAIFGGLIAGLFLGWRLGAGMTALYGNFFHFPILQFSVSLKIVAWSFVISLGAASFGAIFAVRRAVKLPPAEAMRPEPPAEFRAGFLETLDLQKYLAPETRIILRNIARQPLKAILSAFGISLSVALLFLGFYFFDAVKRIAEVQFDQVQREDVEISFSEPRPGRTRYDLARMPGVFAVEAYRVVPARLRYENRVRRVGLTGLESGVDLRRVVDKNLRVVRMPPEGIVLTKTLADALGARKGDFLTVEITEGARPVREIEIAAVVEELVGLGAYLDKNALNRLMREADTISGAYLSVDSQQAANLYSKLKKTPAVAGVGRPQAALDSFNETLAKTIGTSTAFLIGFACVIAFGVVYNGAHIALSERGRELASLRVLGFTQREIGVMLLGEQAILTALAVPLGYTIGFGICFAITKVVNVEIIRLPMVLSARTFVYSFLIVACAALLSGLLVAWRLKNLDLIEVLKTRE